MQDSDKVPHHYCRPGPGDYEVDPRIGTNNHASQFKNSPAYTIPKPKTVVDGFVTIEQFKRDRYTSITASPGKFSSKRSKSPSAEGSVERDINQHDINTPMHRFIEYASDVTTRKKMLKMLYPGRS